MYVCSKGSIPWLQALLLLLNLKIRRLTINPSQRRISSTFIIQTKYHGTLLMWARHADVVPRTIEERAVRVLPKVEIYSLPCVNWRNTVLPTGFGFGIQTENEAFGADIWLHR
jgi:hypothetical protein